MSLDPSAFADKKCLILPNSEVSLNIKSDKLILMSIHFEVVDIDILNSSLGLDLTICSDYEATKH